MLLYLLTLFCHYVTSSDSSNMLKKSGSRKRHDRQRRWDKLGNKLLRFASDPAMGMAPRKRKVQPLTKKNLAAHHKRTKEDYDKRHKRGAKPSGKYSEGHVSCVVLSFLLRF
jgi:hypothetical protein